MNLNLLNIMSKYFILLTLCLFYQTVNAQTYMYDRQGNVIGSTHIQLRNKSEVTLFDTLTGNKFLLDTTHTFISAYNYKDSLLWRTDPWKDNNLDEYRTRRPIISYFKFITEYWCYDESIKKSTKTLAISYNNTQFGYLELSNGKFHFCGQD